MKYLPYGEAFYDEDTVTDQPERQIVSELVREKALYCLEEEIPHGIAVVIESMKFRKASGKKNREKDKEKNKEKKEGAVAFGSAVKSSTIADIEATIVCERESHKGIIIGKQGAMLKRIGSKARPEIEDMLGCKVNLQLWVKVRKDWRDSDLYMKNFGYNPKESE